MVREDAAGCVLDVRVTPRAGRNAIEPERNGRLVIRVTAPPADGAANKAVCALVAKTLRVPKRAVSVRVGSSARAKTIAVEGRSADEALALLASYFEK